MKVSYLMHTLRTFCLLAVALAISALRADYLYWQLDSTHLSGQDFIFNGAHVVAVDNQTGEVKSDIAHYYVEDGSYVPETYAAYGEDPDGNGTTGEVYADLSDLGGGYSYFIELVNYDEGSGVSTQVAKSQGVSYSDLSNYLTGNLGEVPGAPTPWHGSGYSAVPEPTSGALLLLGAGLAAFKKRRNLKDLLKRKA